MNKKVRNRVLLGVSAVLLVCLSVGATLAFLTDTTGTVKNTFTVGNVSIVNGGLDEADVNEYGEPVDDNGETQAEVGEGWTAADRVTENEYKLIPGHTYVKDPTIHIDATSEEAYVFFTINRTNLTWTADNGTTHVLEAATETNGYQNIYKQIEDNGWNPLMKLSAIGNNSYEQVLAGGDSGDPVYYYKTTVAAGKDNGLNGTFASSGVIDLPIFEEFKLKEDLTDADFPASTKLDKLKIEIKAYVVQADGFTDALDAWNKGFGTSTTPEGGN